MFKPFFYAVCGAAGFCLSFLVGIFNRAAFAVIFAKALVFGVAFAALALLFHLILSRFVPDLFGESSAPVAEAASSASSLDITIDDEDDTFLDSDPDVPDFIKSAAKSEGGESVKANAQWENTADAVSAVDNDSGNVSESGKALSDVSMGFDSQASQEEDISDSSDADAKLIAKAISTVLAKE